MGVKKLLRFRQAVVHLELEALQVTKQKNGIGTELINKLKEYAKENQIEEIHTEAIFDTIPFYNKQGFFTLEPTSAVTKMCFLFNNPINTSQLSLDFGV